MIQWNFPTVILEMVEHLMVSAIGPSILIAVRIGSYNLLHIFLLLSDLLLPNRYVVLLG